MTRSRILTWASAVCAVVSAAAAEAQTRPYQLSVYVLGSVQRPGEYPYRNGTTVLHAIALAGGYYRAQDAGLRLERDAIVAAGDLRVMLRKRATLDVRRARIEAEVAGECALPSLAESGTPSEVAAFVAEEKRLLETNCRSFNEDAAKLTEQVTLLNAEIRSLQLYIDAQGREGDVIRRELSEVRSMVDRGLAPTARQYLLERSMAQIDGKQRELETFISRARQTISRTEQGRQGLVNQRRKALVGELQQAQVDAGELEKRIDTTRKLLAEAEGLSLSGPADRANPRPGYVILRGEGDALQEMAATETTRLEPGDVVRIQTLGPPPAGTVTTGALADSSPVAVAAARR